MLMMLRIPHHPAGPTYLLSHVTLNYAADVRNGSEAARLVRVASALTASELRRSDAASNNGFGKKLRLARERFPRHVIIAASAEQAKVICFLASSNANFVTGLTTDATGGLPG